MSHGAPLSPSRRKQALYRPSPTHTVLQNAARKATASRRLPYGKASRRGIYQPSAAGWRKQAGRGPSFPQAVHQPGVRHSGTFSRLYDEHLAQWRLDEPINACVAALLRLRFPTAILGRVRALVIDASQRHARRASSHVCHEVQKIVPAFADLDASSAVVLKTRVVGVITALSHAAPDGVERMAFRHPVRAVTQDCGFSTQASAAATIPAVQTIHTDGFFHPAITSRIDVGIPASLGRATQDRPSSESLSRNTRYCWPPPGRRQFISHRSGPNPGWWLGTAPWRLRNTRSRPACSAPMIALPTQRAYTNVHAINSDCAQPSVTSRSPRAA
jgi:hypothetical protein